MSLEAIIQENTAAIKALAAILTAQASSGAVVAQAAAAVIEQPKGEEKKPDASAQGTAQSAASQTASTTGSTDVTYEATRQLVLKNAAAHRDAIKGINAKHGIPKLSALLKDENDVNSVTDQAKLNAIHADLLALG